MPRKTLASRLALAAFLAAVQALAADWPGKTDPWVLQTAARGETEFLVMLREQADLSGASRLTTRAEKGAFVLDALRSVAEQSQGPLLAFLGSRGVPHRAFWVANAVWVRGDARLVEELEAREDVFHIYANPKVRFEGPVSEAFSAEIEAPDTIEWGVTKVRAPEVWNLGYTGQGTVVAGADTGYQWDHPAIKNQYRGFTGFFADHNYNWHDSIHSGGGVCGADSPVPCDDDSHGTHTMGTMVGDDGGANQIGVAPGARWIGCRNMDQGNGTPATYTECFEWFIAPTDLAGNNPDPTRAPHVINNSWSCPPSEGCTDPAVLQTVVENTRAAGIVVVVSAGNSGSACSTVSTPAAIYDASFSIGATDSSDNIAGFSSRGPVTVDGSNRLKPDVSAPGVSVRSSVPGGGYSVFSGTSMAGPHVAGLVGLLLSASPGLQPAVDVDSVEDFIRSSCVPRTTAQTCGGVPGNAIPNNTYGWGRVDALGAVQASGADLSISVLDAPDPAVPGLPLTYSIAVTNLGPAPAIDVTVSDLLPASVTFGTATPSQGSCGIVGLIVTCDLGGLAFSATATVDIVVTPQSTGTILNAAGASGPQFDPVAANDSVNAQTTVVDCPFPAPAITAPVSVPPATSGNVASVPAQSGHSVAWTILGGTITAGQGTSQITFDSGAAGSTMTLGATDSIPGCSSPEAQKLVSVDYLDVPPPHIFHDDINTLARSRITQGCGGGLYCPDLIVTRAQMAIFLIRGILGPDHVPPPYGGQFVDVLPGDFGADYIGELYSLGITSGCETNPLRYCPNDPVTRAQMAILLLRAKFGPGHMPPDPTGIFVDVPIGSFADRFIEQLYLLGITEGCIESPLSYCPNDSTTRGSMAVFLVRTFLLM